MGDHIAPRTTTLMGLPGRLTPTSLTILHPLTLREWEDKLTLLTHIGGAVQWWAADLLNWGANHFGEHAAQGFSRLDALYAPQTQLNLAYVGRCFPPERRRELPVTFSHHASVSGMDPATQDHWLDCVQTGELLPNGERRLWSVARLRDAIRAEHRVPKTGCSHVCPWHPKEAP